MKRILKILSFVLLFLLVAALGSYLLLQQRSRRLLRYAVEELSDGKYTAKSARVRVSLFPVYVRIDKLRVQPVDSTTMPKYVLLEADSTRLRINNLMGLVNFRKLNVELLTMYNPRFTSVFEDNKQQAKRPFNQAINDLQKGFIDVLQELKVDNCRIVDGAIRIVPAANNQRPFSLNHLYLTLDSIRLSENPTTPGRLQFNGVVTVELRRPDLQLPGKGMEGAVNYLKATSVDHSMMIDSLRFWHRQPGGLTDSAILSAIRLKNLHWNSFFDRGILEIDSTYVARGIINLGILRQQADALADTDTAAGNLGYHGQQFQLHHVQVNDISYGLKAVDTVGNRGTAYLDVRGDRLQLRELTLLQDRMPALDIKDLTLQIRDFRERNLSTGISSTLGALEIRSKVAEIRNIRFSKEPAKPGGQPTVLELPVLRLEDYILSQVFLQRYNARRIVLVSPRFVGDIGKRNRASPLPKRSIADITDLLRDKVDVQELSIENLSAVLNPSAPEDEQILITGLDADLDARLLLKAQNYRDIIRSLTNLRSGRLQLTARETKLALRGLTIDKESLSLHLDTITGKLPGNIGVQLQDVLVQAKPLEQQLDPANNVFDFKGVSIGSGMLNMPAPVNRHKTGSRPGSSGFLLRTDSFALRRLELKMNSKPGAAASASVTAAAQALTLRRGRMEWDKLNLGSVGGLYQAPQVEFSYGFLSVLQPGFLRISNTRLSINQPSTSLQVAAPEIDFTLGLRSSNPERLRITNLKFRQPRVELLLQDPPPDAPTRSVNLPMPVFIDQLELKEPAADIQWTNNRGPMRIQSTGGHVQINDIRLAQGNLTGGAQIGKLSVETPRPKISIGEVHLQPEAISLDASKVMFRADKRIQGLLEKAAVQGFAYNTVSDRNDSISLWLQEAGLRNQPFNTAEYMNIRKILGNAGWWVKGLDADMRNLASVISVRNAQVSAKDGTLNVDSFLWKPSKDRDAFWQQFAFQKTWLALSTGHISARLGSIAHILNDSVLDVKSLQVNDLHLLAQRNKTYPDDTVRYRPLPARHLQQVPVGLKIDSLLFTNGYVRSTTIAEKSGREGNIYFSNLRGSITNIKNRDVMPNDSLRLRATTLLMDSGKLNMQFSQSYADSLQTFLMQARMQQFNLVRLDSLLKPLLNIQIKSGNISSMRLQVKGNDMLAFGNMDLRYNHLKLTLLDKQGKNRFLFSKLLNGLANTLVANKDNGRSDVVYTERKREKAIFNFWSGIAISGLLTNLGIKKDKKQIKKYKRQAHRLQLPDYTEE